MFTGIIEEIGEVVGLIPAGDSAVLRVRAARIGAELAHGASIAVNGVCLTVVGQRPAEAAAGQRPAETAMELDFDVMAETLKRSVVGSLLPGSRVNSQARRFVDREQPRPRFPTAEHPPMLPPDYTRRGNRL